MGNGILDNKGGRPSSEDPKVSPPSFRVKRSVLEKVENISISSGRSTSEIFEAALELYFSTDKDIQGRILELAKKTGKSPSEIYEAALEIFFKTEELRTGLFDTK